MISGIKGLWRWFKQKEANNREPFEKMKATLIGAVFAIVSASAAAVEYSPVVAEIILNMAGPLLAFAVSILLYRCWEFVEYELGLI